MERHALMDAAEWFVRLQDQKVNPGTRERFTDWLLLSPDHVAAYIEVSEIYGRLGIALVDEPSKAELVSAAKADPEPTNVVALSTVRQESQDGIAAKRRAHGWGTWAAVAACVLVVFGVLTAVAVTSWIDPRYSTQVGEQRSVSLDDGSLISLNTNSELVVQYSDYERRILMERGEARFIVARDAKRPFIVKTKHASVQAIGTIFNVQTDPARTAIAVIEGRIAVTGQADIDRSGLSGSGRPPRIVLETGQQVAVTRQGKMLRNGGPPLERVIAWPDRQLVFRDEPLIDLVTDFNRYHKQQLRIVDPSLAGHQVNGTFDAFDRKSLLEYLERYQGVEVQDGTDGSVLLLRADATPQRSR